MNRKLVLFEEIFYKFFIITYTYLPVMTCGKSLYSVENKVPGDNPQQLVKKSSEYNRKKKFKRFSLLFKIFKSLLLIETVQQY